jgi:hypothetical protein
VLKLIELRQKKWHATAGRYATCLASSRTLRRTWEVEKRMHNDAPFRDFEMTERSGSLLNDIGEQRAEGTKLYEQMCRLDYGM